MPTIRTGNQEWDQNLNTLGNALFPDPSKAAQGYYLGTQSRQNLLESAKTQNQLAAGNTQLGMTFGRAPNPTYRPGPFDTSIMIDPYAVPAAPGPTAPPAAPGQAVPPQSALPTLAAAVTTMPPQALANAVVAGVENNASSGPGPEATGSNGTVPQNGPGTFQPGSVTSAGGGGVIMSGPGAADGTPAPAAFNFGQAVALGVAAGQTPEQAYAVARGTLGNMVKNGQIALPLAEQIAAFYGVPNMRVQTLADQGAMARTQVTEAGATTRTGMTEAGATTRAGMATTFVPDPDPAKAAQGAGSYVPLAQQQGPGGYRGTNPAAVTEMVKPSQIVTAPGAAPTYTTTGQAMQTGATSVPTGGDQQTAILDAAILAARNNPELLKELTDAKLRLAAIPKGAVDPKTNFDQLQVNYETDQMAYPQPDPLIADLTVKAPVAFTTDAERAVNDRTKVVKTTGRGYMLNDTEARREAVRQLQDENVLYKPDEINAMRRESIRSLTGRDIRIQTFKPAGKPASEHMMIGLKPKPGETAKTTGAAATTAAPISTVIPGPEKNRQINRASVPGRPAGAAQAAPVAPATTAATPAGPPPGATMKVPAGTPDGPFQLSTGEVGTAVGGYYIPPTR